MEKVDTQDPITVWCEGKAAAVGKFRRAPSTDGEHPCMTSALGGRRGWPKKRRWSKGGCVNFYTIDQKGLNYLKNPNIVRTSNMDGPTCKKKAKVTL